MTREYCKEYNAENYPASVLSWLNATVDKIYDNFKNQTCSHCKHYSKQLEQLEKECTLGINKASPTFGCHKWRDK